MQNNLVKYAARTIGCKTNVSFLNANTGVLYYCCDQQQILQAIVTEDATYLQLMPITTSAGKQIPERNVHRIYTQYPPFYVSIDMLTSYPQGFDHIHQRIFIVNIISLDQILQLRVTLNVPSSGHSFSGNQLNNQQMRMTNVTVPGSINAMAIGQMAHIPHIGVIGGQQGGTIMSGHNTSSHQIQSNTIMSIRGTNNVPINIDIPSIYDIAAGRVSIKIENRMREALQRQMHFPILAEVACANTGVQDGTVYVMFYTANGLKLESYGPSREYKQSEVLYSTSLFPHFCINLKNHVLPEGKKDNSGTSNSYETIESDLFVAECTSSNSDSGNFNHQPPHDPTQKPHQGSTRGQIGAGSQFRVRFRNLRKQDNPTQTLMTTYGSRSERIVFECYELNGQSRSGRFDIQLTVTPTSINIIAINVIFTLNNINPQQNPSQQGNLSVGGAVGQMKEISMALLFGNDYLMKTQFCRCENPSLYVQTQKNLYKYTSSSLIQFLFQRAQPNARSKIDLGRLPCTYLATEVIALPSEPLKPFFLLNKAEYIYNRSVGNFYQAHKGCQVILYK